MREVNLGADVPPSMAHAWISPHEWSQHRITPEKQQNNSYDKFHVWRSVLNFRSECGVETEIKKEERNTNEQYP